MAYCAQSTGDIKKFDMGSLSTHVEPPFELEKIFEIFDNFEKFEKNLIFSKCH